MLFNTLEFGIFFAIVFTLNWALSRDVRVRNLILLASSMVFYAMLDYTFPVYLMALIGVSYGMARVIEKQQNERKRKWLLTATLVVLSAGLVYTKYSEFILGNITGLAQWQASALGILIPVGISFYTFAVIGYVLDVYYESIEVERNFLTYATYISFFPHLLAGPIPAATTLLPQFNNKPRLSTNLVIEGISEFLWGLFKKMVIADNILIAVNYCFSANNDDLSGSSLFVGAALFGAYIYADFSGYSEMARGCAKLLGIDIVRNFNTPFFSTSVSEYWRRWHISLTNWLNAYIYGPITFGLMRWGKAGVLITVFLTFLISGIWHGAGWQYIIFGVINGLAIIFEIVTKDVRAKIFGKLPRMLNNVISNFFVVVFMLVAWVFFKADGLPHAMNILKRICSASLFTAPESFVAQYLVWVLPMVVVEFVQQRGKYILDVQQWLPVKVTRKDRDQRKKINYLHIAICVVLLAVTILCIYLFHKKVNMAEYYYFKF